MLINLLRDHQPDDVAVAFDRPEPTFRHEAVDDLQGQPRRGARHPAPADGPGAPGGRGAAASRSSSRPGFEADDIIATLATEARDAGRRRPHRHRRPRQLPARRGPARQGALQQARRVRLRALRRGRHRRAHRRAPRRSTSQYAALRGDPSDNLPGVPGRGGEDGGQAHHHLRRPRRHLRAPRRADAEAAPEPGRARGAGAAERRGDGAACATSPLDGRPGRPRHGRARRRGGAPAVRLPRVPHAATTGWPRRSATTSAPRRASTAEVLEAEVRRVDDRGRGGRGARRAWPTADRAAGRGRRPGRAPRAARRSTAWPSSPTPAAAEVAWLPARLLADADGRATRSPPLVGRRRAPARGPRGQAADAQRSPSSASTCRTLALDTMLAAYLLDPAETRYLLERAARPLRPARSCPTRRRPRRGPARLRRRRRSTPALDRRPPRRSAVDRLVGPLLRGARRPGPARRSTTTSRSRSSRVLARMEDVGVGVDVAELQPLNDQLVAECDALSAPDRRGRRARSSTSTPRRSCARSCSTSSASRRRRRPRPGFSTDAAVAREARRPAPDHRAPAALPRGREAAVDLRRGPAGRGRPRRSHPRHLQPDRGPHRPAVSSDAPNLHNIPVRSRGGPGVPQGVRPRRRATSCWSPTTTRSSCAASPTWPRTPG